MLSTTSHFRTDFTQPPVLAEVGAGERDPRCVISEKNEADVWGTLEALLESISGAYVTSLEEDEEALRVIKAEREAGGEREGRGGGRRGSSGGEEGGGNGWGGGGGFGGGGHKDGDEGREAVADESAGRSEDVMETEAAAAGMEGEERAGSCAGRAACLAHTVSQKRIVHANMEWVQSRLRAFGI